MPTGKRGKQGEPTKRDRTRPAAPKLQRWIDLLAAMLSRTFPATFDELRRAVPAYAAGDGPTLMRMFERDKDELRAFGVPIETVTTSDGGEVGYRVRRQDFYLPFLAIASAGASKRPSVPAEGYRSLAHLAFEPAEFEAIADAAARVRQLGELSLSADANEAMRKLAFDLPADALRSASEERIVVERVEERTFGVLSRALLDRKVVTFDYHSMASDQTRPRQVEPYGLAFLGAHWYLVARDPDLGELRTFRVSRMTRVTANHARAQSADYEIPATFDLEQYAQTRDAWALGPDHTVDAVVEFRGSSGATRAATRLGASVRGAPTRRRFQVRRTDTFLRWLLSVAGDAVPIEPPELVEQFQTIARETLELYGASA